MYYYISGTLAFTDTNFAVIDAGGVGYKLFISGTTLGKLNANKSEKVKLYTYFSVKEDAMELYGFYTTEELAAFKLLISVSGVGAKSAISVLSLMSPERFAVAVTTSDTKAIAKAPGVGAKTAARIVLELKDKIAKEIKTEDIPADLVTEGAAANSNASEAQNALMVLGYTRAEVLYALKGIDTEKTELEEIIRTALKKLMKT